MKKTTHYLFLLLVTLFCVSCENEPVDTKFDPSLLVSKNSDIIQEMIKVAKYANTSRENVCIEFVYPFAILEVDDNLELVQVHSIFGSDQLISFLENLNDGYSISISYPLGTILPNGDLFMVSNNSELKIALELCTLDDIISACDDLFSGNNGATCVWKVPYSSGSFDNKFAGTVFNANGDGTIQLFYDNTTYLGTWTFVFINSELYLNIFLTGNSLVSQYWNVNFKADMSLDAIVLSANGITINLKKSCELLAPYSVGQPGRNGGIITHVKTEYSEGWRFLEIANQDEIQEEWGCINASIVLAQNNQIGGGLMNSIAIANYHDGINYLQNPSVCSSENNGSVSAKTALLSAYPSKNWHIPTIDELQLIYTSIHLNGLGDFSEDIYWSSTEASANSVFGINFADGTILEIQKNSEVAKTRKCIYF